MFMLLSLGDIICYSQLLYFSKYQYFQNKKKRELSGSDPLKTLIWQYLYIFFIQFTECASNIQPGTQINF